MPRPELGREGDIHIWGNKKNRKLDTSYWARSYSLPLCETIYMYPPDALL